MYPLGAGGGVRIRGFSYQTTACVCLVTGMVVGWLCVVEGVGLVAAAVGWRMSSWLGNTGVLFVLAGLLDYCRQNWCRNSTGCEPVFPWVWSGASL